MNGQLAVLHGTVVREKLIFDLFATLLTLTPITSNVCLLRNDTHVCG